VSCFHCLAVLVGSLGCQFLGLGPSLQEHLRRCGFSFRPDLCCNCLGFGPARAHQVLCLGDQLGRLCLSGAQCAFGLSFGLGSYLGGSTTSTAQYPGCLLADR
jgi:hypothetical protein